jgi:hypothetical protein
VSRAQLENREMPLQNLLELGDKQNPIDVDAIPEQLPRMTNEPPPDAQHVPPTLVPRPPPEVVVRAFQVPDMGASLKAREEALNAREKQVEELEGKLDKRLLEFHEAQAKLEKDQTELENKEERLRAEEKKLVKTAKALETSRVTLKTFEAGLTAAAIPACAQLESACDRLTVVHAKLQKLNNGEKQPVAPSPAQAPDPALELDAIAVLAGLPVSAGQRATPGVSTRNGGFHARPEDA